MIFDRVIWRAFVVSPCTQLPIVFHWLKSQICAHTSTPITGTLQSAALHVRTFVCPLNTRFPLLLKNGVQAFSVHVPECATAFGSGTVRRNRSTPRATGARKRLIVWSRPRRKPTLRRHPWSQWGRSGTETPSDSLPSSGCPVPRPRTPTQATGGVGYQACHNTPLLRPSCNSAELPSQVVREVRAHKGCPEPLISEHAATHRYLHSCVDIPRIWPKGGASVAE
jgi:hypothetical protein